MFAITFGSITFFILLESLIPRRHPQNQQTQRWLSNISISLFNFFLLSFVSITLSNSSWLHSLLFFKPILHQVHFNLFSEFILILIIFEFFTYFFHRLMHTIPLLWRIHAVHHCDIDVDASTTNRHHFLEPILSLFVFIPIIVILGPSFLALILFNLFRTFMSTMTHSNIYIPQVIERYLCYFMVTPDFHRLHHSSSKKYTNSNYGTVVPWFDYIFVTNTSIPFKQQEGIQLGLEYFRQSKESRVDSLLLMPFVWKK